MRLDGIITRLYALNVGAVGQGLDRHERPHKPVLWLAALEQIDRGAPPDRLAWDAPLRASFKRYFAIVRQKDDRPSPELPFFHMRSDGLWRPVRLDGSAPAPLTRPPLVRDQGQVAALMAPEVAAALADPGRRAALRGALIARYFPGHRDALLALARGRAAPAQPEAPDAPGRSAAFRRLVLSLYDHQCAACGLRLKLGDPPISLVDAAHLIPFAESRDDHPANGLALCKNHHWAMDRALIAPTPTGRWRASPALIPRRSSGEAELAALDGARLLPPRDPTYAPRPAGLLYRARALLGAA